MALVNLNLKPDDRTLRQFAWMCALFFPLLTWLFTGRPWPGASELADWKWVGILGAIGLVIAVGATIYPKVALPVFMVLTLVAFPIGLVVSEVIIFVIYFLVFLPIALLFRLIGRDALERRFEPTRATYWADKRQPGSVRQYFRQY